MRQTVSSGSPLESVIGFSRAVRVGPYVAVAGTAPIAVDGGVACPGDAYGQTKRCLEIAAKAIRDTGCSPGSGQLARLWRFLGLLIQRGSSKLNWIASLGNRATLRTDLNVNAISTPVYANPQTYAASTALRGATRLPECLPSIQHVKYRDLSAAAC
jgi:hypothetical protein